VTLVFCAEIVSAISFTSTSERRDQDFRTLQEYRARLRQPAERQNKRDQQGCHRPESLSPVAGKFNGSNVYEVFRRHSSAGVRSPGIKIAAITDPTC
jgi:hypothetical protein